MDRISRVFPKKLGTTISMVHLLSFQLTLSSIITFASGMYLLYMIMMYINYFFNCYHIVYFYFICSKLQYQHQPSQMWRHCDCMSVCACLYAPSYRVFYTFHNDMQHCFYIYIYAFTRRGYFACMGLHQLNLLYILLCILRKHRWWLNGSHHFLINGLLKCLSLSHWVVIGEKD